MCRIEPDDEVGPGQPPAPLPFGVDLEARDAETRKIFAKPGERGPEVEQGADEHVASRSGETVEVDRVDHAPRPAPSPRRAGGCAILGEGGNRPAERALLLKSPAERVRCAH